MFVVELPTHVIFGNDSLGRKGNEREAAADGARYAPCVSCMKDAPLVAVLNELYAPLPGGKAAQHTEEMIRVSAAKTRSSEHSTRPAARYLGKCKAQIGIVLVRVIANDLKGGVVPFRFPLRSLGPTNTLGAFRTYRISIAAKKIAGHTGRHKRIEAAIDRNHHV